MSKKTKRPTTTPIMIGVLLMLFDEGSVEDIVTIQLKSISTVTFGAFGTISFESDCSNDWISLD